MYIAVTKPIYLPDKLIPKNVRLYYLARNFVKENDYKYCWVSYGKVFLRQEDGKKRKLVSSEEGLSNQITFIYSLLIAIVIRTLLRLPRFLVKSDGVICRKIALTPSTGTSANTANALQNRGNPKSAAPGTSSCCTHKELSARCEQPAHRHPSRETRRNYNCNKAKCTVAHGTTSIKMIKIYILI